MTARGRGHLPEDNKTFTSTYVLGRFAALTCTELRENPNFVAKRNWGPNVLAISEERLLPYPSAPDKPIYETNTDDASRPRFSVRGTRNFSPQFNSFGFQT